MISAISGWNTSIQPAAITRIAAIRKLASRDSDVRAHEQAHLAAAGPYSTTGASYTFQLGPDGQRYAVGGEVGIDVSPDSSSPQRTLDKARTVQAAANAPADPSPQDRQVAAAAAQMAAQAESEMASQGSSDSGGYGDPQTVELGQLIDLVA